MPERTGNAKKEFGWLIMITLILFGWNYHEILHRCNAGSCNFLQNMAIKDMIKEIVNNKSNSFCLLLHSLYHNIRGLSVVHAASFFSLFAMVIALIQAMYPYRLGEKYGYPIRRLDRTFNKPNEIKGLLFCTVVAVTAEILNFCIVEAGVVIIGYWIIGKWIYEIVIWYKEFEDIKSKFTDRFRNNLETILKKQGEKKEEEKEAYELIERIVQSGGIEEREILAGMASALYQYEDELKWEQGQIIFTLSFYIAELLSGNYMAKTKSENSWPFRLLKESMLEGSRRLKERDKDDDQMWAEEAFMLGILCGCVTENDLHLSTWCIYDMISELLKQADEKRAVEMICMFCVFLELYSNINEMGIHNIEIMINDPNFIYLIRDSVFSVNLNDKLLLFYSMLLRLDYVEAITEYDLTDVLLEELAGIQEGIPKTMFGVMLACSGKGK